MNNINIINFGKWYQHLVAETMTKGTRHSSDIYPNGHQLGPKSLHYLPYIVWIDY
jgi:hypothetical protein